MLIINQINKLTNGSRALRIVIIYLLYKDRDKFVHCLVNV